MNVDMKDLSYRQHESKSAREPLCIFFECMRRAIDGWPGHRSEQIFFCLIPPLPVGLLLYYSAVGYLNTLHGHSSVIE